MHHYLNETPGKKVTENLGRTIFKQIVSAIAYLHSKKIAHRDIKLENILINKHKQIKLIDFGFALKLEKGGTSNQHLGTPAYLAPEIIKKTNYDPLKSDIWTLGILLFILMNGCKPFSGNDR